MPKRVMLAAEAGCTGIVCAAADLKDAHSYAPRLDRVVPGIRLAGSGADDQARPAAPAEAVAGGADLLVIGRTVTAADDPVAAAERLVAELRVHAAPVARTRDHPFSMVLMTNPGRRRLPATRPSQAGGLR